MHTHINSRVAARLIIIAILGSTLAACGGGNSDLVKWTAEVRARPLAPIDPLPVMQQFETFEYAAQDLRDPFSDAFIAAEGSGPRPDAGRPKQPLEQFPLDGFDMVGTMGSGAALVALVTAPDKVTYRIRPGAYLGQSDGRVTGVYEDRIELVELVPDGAGGWLERPAAIALEDG